MRWQWIRPAEIGVTLRIELLQRLDGHGFDRDADPHVSMTHEIIVGIAPNERQVIPHGGVQRLDPHGATEMLRVHGAPHEDACPVGAFGNTAETIDRGPIEDASPAFDGVLLFHVAEVGQIERPRGVIRR